MLLLPEQVALSVLHRANGQVGLFTFGINKTGLSFLQIYLPGVGS